MTQDTKMTGDLLPCPFCGGEAELDTAQAYRALSGGKIGDRATVYCLKCSADMGFCYEDAPGTPREDIVNQVVDDWNRRAALEPAPAPTQELVQLNAIVDAWEALPGGRQVRSRDVEAWLAEHMAPAIDAIRGFLRRPRPDGVLPAAPQGEATVHPDDIAVDRFADAMKSKLAKKRDEGRAGWENKDECSAEYLSQLLREHVDKGDPIDVANLAMMLHQRGEAIALAKQGGQ